MNYFVVTDAMMTRGTRAAADNSLEDACATAHAGAAPPISNHILAMVAHELRGRLTPLRLASQLIRKRRLNARKYSG
ncbi:hypothetical protein [Paraburkholderia sp.]|uniref:hypothetical protein n=1 Tax=Paraburkholderia sp. TaxID=1926495 RepID=UPI002AFF08D7|nr:hypothetical protein [Paraburkholderia sp.]